MTTALGVHLQVANGLGGGVVAHEVQGFFLMTHEPEDALHPSSFTCALGQGDIFAFARRH